MKLVFTPSNLAFITNGAILGASVGALGTVFSDGLVEQRQIHTIPGCYTFIHRNEDIASLLGNLHDMLHMTNSRYGLDSFPRLCHYLNQLAECSELVETTIEIPLHINYTVNEIVHAVNCILDLIIDEDFVIHSLGTDICTSIEKLQGVISDIVYNVHQETSMRIMDSSYPS